MPQSGVTTSGQSGPRTIPQSLAITRVPPSDCLVSYPVHSLVGSYSSAEKQSVYSTATTDWVSPSIWFSTKYSV